MTGRSSRPAGDSTVLLFGPQALSFDKHSFSRLRTCVLSSTSQHWVLNTIERLPDYWDVLCKEFPKLLIIPGAELLQDLGDWFRDGLIAQQATSSHLPNILLIPLVVIAQLSQYSEYLKHSGSKYLGLEDPYTPAQSDTETLGFCTGILSAIVVSCSTNQTQFAEHGGTAVRLAMLIGALLDAQDAQDGEGEWRSLATVWRSQSMAELDMARILRNFPEVE